MWDTLKIYLHHMVGLCPLYFALVGRETLLLHFTMTSTSLPGARHYILLDLSLLHFAPMLRYIKVGVNFLMILRRSSHAPRAIKCDGLKDSMREIMEAQKKVDTKSPSGSFFWCSHCTTGRQCGKG